MTIWYQTGTVDASNGSASVVGHSTAWSLGSNVFLGEAIVIAGATYEITGVSSATAMTISPVFSGTATGVAYLIIPVQGYTKSLATQVASLISSYTSVGTGDFTGLTRILTDAGSVGTPSLQFVGGTTTGLYLASAGVLGVAASGTAIAQFHSAYLTLAAGSVSAPTLIWSTDTTTGLYRSAANALGVAVSGVKILDVIAGGLEVKTAITTPSTTFAIANTTATTVNFAGAATTLNLGAATGTLTVANTTLAAKAGTFSTTLGVTGASTLAAATLSGLLTANAGLSVPTGQAVTLAGTTTLSVGGTSTFSGVVTNNAAGANFTATPTNVNYGGVLSLNTLQTTNTAARNWMWGSNFTNFGDVVLRVSNSLGGDPYTAGTTILSASSTALTLASGVNLVVQGAGTLSVGGQTILASSTTYDVGVGVTPSAWYKGGGGNQWNAIELPGGSLHANATTTLGLMQNAYASSLGGFKKVASGYANWHYMNAGGYTWNVSNAGAGSAGDAITWTTVGSISAAGAWSTNGGSLTAGAINTTDVLAGVEISEPAAPAANGYKIFAIDSGGGKTILKVRFASGASQTIATEP